MYAQFQRYYSSLLKVLAPDCVNEPAPDERSYATNYDSTEVGGGENNSASESESSEFSDEENGHDESAAALDGTHASHNSFTPSVPYYFAIVGSERGGCRVITHPLCASGRNPKP